jgi:hypothetical protein
VCAASPSPAGSIASVHLLIGGTSEGRSIRASDQSR